MTLIGNLAVAQRTLKECKASVEFDGLQIKYVPSEHVSDELCIMALTQNKNSYMFISDHHKTGIVNNFAIKVDPSNIAFHPKDTLTYDKCVRAVEYDPYNINQVPDHLNTPELCLKALNLNPMCIYCINDSMVTDQMCFRAMELDAKSISVFRVSFMTNAVSLAIGKISPEKVYTGASEDVWIELLKISDKSARKRIIGCVRSKYWTEDFCLRLLNYDISFIEYFPKSLSTKPWYINL